MTPNYKPFYAFLLSVLVAAIAFGLYVSGLESCNKSAIGPIECHKMYLAFGVLFSLAILLVLGAGMYALLPLTQGVTDLPGKTIFDGFIKALPPIATLVLGYYFGTAQTAGKAAEEKNKNPPVSQTTTQTTDSKAGQKSDQPATPASK